MEWLPLLYQVLEVCIIPLLGILTAYFVKWVNAKSAEVQNKVDNATADKYITLLNDTICACVIATTQTYVDALKGQNAFDPEAQKKAFEMTKTAVLSILTEDAKEYLNSALGDFDEYLKTLIEAQVQVNKLATAN